MSARDEVIDLPYIEIDLGRRPLPKIVSRRPFTAALVEAGATRRRILQVVITELHAVPDGNGEVAVTLSTRGIRLPERFNHVHNLKLQLTPTEGYLQGGHESLQSFFE